MTQGLLADHVASGRKNNRNVSSGERFALQRIRCVNSHTKTAEFQLTMYQSSRDRPTYFFWTDGSHLYFLVFFVAVQGPSEPQRQLAGCPGDVLLVLGLLAVPWVVAVIQVIIRVIQVIWVVARVVRVLLFQAVPIVQAVAVVVPVVRLLVVQAVEVLQAVPVIQSVVVPVVLSAGLSGAVRQQRRQECRGVVADTVRVMDLQAQEVALALERLQFAFRQPETSDVRAV